MAEQEMLNHPDRNQSWWNDLLFLRIFQGFRMAIQPGKLLLGIMAVLALFMGGWIMDELTPRGNRVIERDGVSELEFYATRMAAGERPDWTEQRRRMEQTHETELRNMLTSGMLSMTELATRTDESAARWVEKVLNDVKTEHRQAVQETLTLLEETYFQERLTEIKERDRSSDTREEAAEQNQQRKEEIAALKDAYRGLYTALLHGESDTADVGAWLDQLGVVEESQIYRTIQLARVKQLAASAYGKGIFASIVDFKLEQLDGALKALFLHRDTHQAKTNIHHLLMMVCWLSRFHPVYMIFFTVLCLVIWSIFGGAICRIAALQIARDERIGAWRALQFSSNKFASFFSAPLIPLGIILFIGALILTGGALGAIPYIGEIFTGLLTGLALFGGFVIALVALGLTGGVFLMYPTIAVEGSDSFDAISRSFSYVFARPWRMIFYMIIGVIYGAVCFLFVRFFVFLLLIATYFPAGILINWWDKASFSFRGKFEAMWTMPTFTNLRTEFTDIPWIGLNPTESIGAFLIWIWVTLAVAAVIGYVISYFFSFNTIIYALLRKHVDDTDLEDVYLDQDLEDLYQQPVESSDVLADNTSESTGAAEVKKRKPKATTAKKKAAKTVKKKTKSAKKKTKAKKT